MRQRHKGDTRTRPPPGHLNPPEAISIHRLAVVAAVDPVPPDLRAAFPMVGSFPLGPEAEEADGVLLLLTEPSPTELGVARAQLARHRINVPVLLVPRFPLAEIWKLGPIGDLAILPFTELDRLAEALSGMVTRDDVGPLLAHVEARVSNPLLATAVRTLFLWRPNRSERAEFPTVGWIARYVGVSKSYLYREARNAGLDLGELIRQLRLIRGVQIRKTTGQSWLRVSLALGFPSHGAWCNFVSRLSGMAPSRLSRVPLPVLVGIAITRVTVPSALQRCEERNA